MNILIPHSWLLEHLETTATPEQIQIFLSRSGPSVERIHDIEEEKVYDIEITTNRVDCMSVRGVAREAAVILTEAGLPARLRPALSVGILPQGVRLPLPTIHNDPKLCNRILCQVVSIHTFPSPDWMQRRLRQIGVKPHDVVIDISNYITHELGHPCHMFDYDKIMTLGGQIFVREAVAGKKFTIIDGTEFTTVGGEIVFENEAGQIIDLPAIKGTKNTAIDSSTKNVLFWIESLDPKKVRFASMSHAIRTVAAELNEKNVDPELGLEVEKLGIKLLCELAEGKVASELYDDYPGEKQLSVIHFQLSEIQRYLGIGLPVEKIISILESLGCSVVKNDLALDITPPAFRPDLEISADIVEEVARIYGYHNLPSTLMTTAIPTNYPQDVNFDIEYETKQFLSTLGAYEIYTYSLIDEKKVLQEGGNHLKISNPLTEDMTHLRTTLWTSHLNVLQTNATHRHVTIFEFANVYIPSTTALPNETLHLTITSSGEERRVKGMLEALAKKYFLGALHYADHKIFAGKTEIGSIVYPQVGIVVLDILWSVFLTLTRKYPLYRPESKFTPVIEDLTFTIPEDQHIGRVLETVQSSDPMVMSVVLKDLFNRNATFTISYASDRQLNTEDVAIVRTKIISEIESKYQAKLVGKIGNGKI